MSSVELSVVMPVYNAEPYLDEAIQSILSQSFTNFEFIIIDDGSTDRSSEIIEKYSKLDSRIKVISQKNHGLIYSLNLGLELSKGRFIARMDADDVSMPKRFELQLDKMKQDCLDLCGCHFLAINSQGQSQWARIVSTSKSGNAIVLSSTVCCAHGSAMLRKQFLMDNNLSYGKTEFDKAEDYALWVQMFENGASISNVDEILFKYRIIPGSLSSNSVNYKHGMKISKKFCQKNFAVIMKAIEETGSGLNEFEQECTVFFLYKNFLKGSFKKKHSLLKHIPIRHKFLALFRVVKSCW